MKFKRDFENFKTQCIPWEMKIKEVESKLKFLCGGSGTFSNIAFSSYKQCSNFLVNSLHSFWASVPSKEHTPLAAPGVALSRSCGDCWEAHGKGVPEGKGLLRTV